MNILENWNSVRVGSKLVVRPDIASLRDCVSGKVPEMDDFAGQTVTVLEFTGSGESVVIEEDPDRWAWSYDLFCADEIFSEHINLSDYLVGDV